MLIKIVGCGNAFSMKNGNQSFLVEEDGRRMLIDCGSRIPVSLAEMGIKLSTIDDFYVSHGHGDHIGGLEEVAFTRYDWSTKPKHYTQGKYAPRLIGNAGFLKDLWDYSLKGGLSSMEGFQSTLETFFEVTPIQPNEPFAWQGWTVDLIQQLHVMAGNVAMWTFGLMFKRAGHKTVYFTTDSQHCSPSQMQTFYRDADVIFQDCELIGNNFQFQEGQKVYEDETGFHAWPEDESGLLIAMTHEPSYWKVRRMTSGVHANYSELAGYPSANHIQLSTEIKAKMWLSHYQDFKMDNKDMYGNVVNWDAQASKDGFQGFITPGQVFEF